MRLRVHREIPEDEEFRRQWNGLVEAMERPQVFYTFEWAAAVAHAYGEVLKPLLFAGYEREKLVGIAALALEAGGDVCFLASATADYCDFVSAPEDRKELIERVMGELRGMGTAEFKLANLPADSASAPVLRAAAKRSGYAVFARPAYFCAQISLRSEEERGNIARSARRNSKRAKKAMAAIGEVAVDHRGTGERLEAELPGLAIAHVARFLAQGRTSNLVDRARRGFLEELGKRLSAPGALALSTLKIGDRTVAWHYGFQYAGSWFWYLPVFDTELQHVKPGPGSCLFYEILLRAAEDADIYAVDLGLGDEGYKDRYAAGGRQTLYVTVDRSRVRLAREFCRYEAAKLVGKVPAVEARVRKAMSWLASVRGRSTAMGTRRALAHYLGRARKVFFDDVEVRFFDWAPQGFLQSSSIKRHGELQLRPLSMNLLAVAAIEYEDDAETREYLLRSAGRLQSGGAEGYALVAGGVPVHFCWVAPFEGFRVAEMGCALEAPFAQSVLLYDGWTPDAQRGRGDFGMGAAMVADLQVEKGKRPWIFEAGPNSIEALGQAGFVPRYSLRRGKRMFFIRRTRRMEFADRKTGVMNLYPAA